MSLRSLLIITQRKGREKDSDPPSDDASGSRDASPTAERPEKRRFLININPRLVLSSGSTPSARQQQTHQHGQDVDTCNDCGLLFPSSTLVRVDKLESDFCPDCYAFRAQSEESDEQVVAADDTEASAGEDEDVCDNCRTALKFQRKCYKDEREQRPWRRNSL